MNRKPFNQKLNAWAQELVRRLDLNTSHTENIFRALQDGQRIFIGSNGKTEDLTKHLPLINKGE